MKVEGRCRAIIESRIKVRERTRDWISLFSWSYRQVESHRAFLLLVPHVLASKPKNYFRKVSQST